MSEHDPAIIQGTPPPLSHLHKKARGKFSVDWRVVGVSAAVLGVLVFAYTWRPQVTSPAAASAAPSPATSAAPATTPVPNSNAALAPFANTQQQRAREQAQAALATFVEQQIKLEDTMQVSQWGQEKLQLAMAQAQTGDREFTAERFSEALAAYEQAAGTLTELIALGDTVFAQHLAKTEQYLDELRAADAAAEINQALAIKANATAALQLKQRVDKLPEIISLLRTAKNHELGERPQQALAVYDQIAALDPNTVGLAALRRAAATAQAKGQVAQFISAGFNLLNSQQFDGARRAFNNALKIEPTNDVAKGGLAQLAKEHDLAVIKQHRRSADEAIKTENWQAAVDAYQAVLKMDRNVQFASNGLDAAERHLRINNLLQKISREPQKLSRQQLYLEAIDILADARALQFPGPKLKSAMDEVDRLIILYRDPVDVVLVSDNATEVVMSNVGQLGRFARKTLSLRPGQYTIRGSQDGCRDIYLSIEVLPGLSAVDVSCQESL